MKFLVMLFFNLSFITSYAQAPEFNERNGEVPYYLSSPANWGVERFPIPIGFAPQIPYKGMEDIRFTPGWAKVASDEYWSYAFLWYLDGEVKMDANIIESNLKQYYSGLITANGSNVPSPIITTFKEVAADSNDFKTYLGTISLFDYMAKQPLLLHCKVHVKSCVGETKTFVFYELSPKPLSHAIWQSLDALWVYFKCKKD